MFKSNNCVPCRLWGKKNLVKHPKISKYYENDCLQNFLLLFMFSLKGKFLKSSHILGRIYFTFPKIFLKQTWSSFNTNIQSQQKDPKSSYKLRQILGLFCHLTALILRPNNLKGLRVTKIVKKKISWKGCEASWNEKIVSRDNNSENIWD